MIFNKILEVDRVNKAVGKVNFREAVRGIIIRDGMILMVHCKNGDYKFPGGGIKKGENHQEALKREIQEETGYEALEIGESEYGIVTEICNDIYEEGSTFKMISYYYISNVSESIKEQNLDEYEKKLEFKGVWIGIDEALKNNENIIANNDINISEWIFRETYVLKEIISEFRRNRL